MDLQGWNARYRSREREAEDHTAPPTPLLTRVLENYPPGRALDLASGTGRNAMWLAQQGWNVTAVDGASAAIETLAAQSVIRNLPVQTQVANLRSGDYTIEASAWDLIAFLYYLQTDLFTSIKSGIRPGGLVIGIVHITSEGEAPTEHRCRPGDLIRHFAGWRTLHYYEGASTDPAHKRPVAEIVAQRPD